MRRRTLANLTHVPPALVEGMWTLLKGGVVMDCLDDWVSIVRALPHGHVQAVLGMCRQLGLEPGQSHLKFTQAAGRIEPCPEGNPCPGQHV